MQHISEAGLVCRGGSVIHIDTDLWTTQAALAKKLGVSRNTINNRVRRYLRNGRLPNYYIEPFGRVIPNVNSLNELGKLYKKQ